MNTTENKFSHTFVHSYAHFNDGYHTAQFGYQINSTHLLLISLLGVLLIRQLILRWKYRKIYKFMSSIPGPPALPFIGITYIMIDATVANILHKFKAIVETYPGLCSLWKGEIPYAGTGDREIVNAILSSLQNIDKLEHYNHIKMISDGIFSTKGAEWRKRRKMMNPCFRSTILGAINENFRDLTQDFIDNLEKHVDGEAFDIFLSVHLCTIDLVFDNLMEVRVHAQKNNLTFLSTNYTLITDLCFERMFSPWFWPDFMYSLLGKQKTYVETRRRLELFIEQVVDHRIKIRDELKDKNHNTSDANRSTFMDVMLNNLKLGLVSREHVNDEVYEMYSAGSITTAMTNSWVFKMLAMFPEIQETAYQEILENSDGKAVTLDDLSKLVYVEMIIKETLRHFGAPITGREITEDLKVNEKITIPAGIHVILGIHSLHHDSKLWQEPTQFFPEHFSSANESNRPKGAFVPFLSGPRYCPGSTYAMKSMKFIVSNALLHYKFSSDEVPPDDIMKIEVRPVLLLWSANGYKVKITKR